jgi:adenine-specific DNA-methyltransferase
LELIWEGKYTPDGKKSSPIRHPLPFQDVETVNESAIQRNLRFDWSNGDGQSTWRNRLVWGDKRYVLPSLRPEFAGKVKLIYIDPPFATGDNFYYTTHIPDDPYTDGEQNGSFVKEPNMLEIKAYRDIWGRGLDGYLQWFYETVLLLHELLADDGSIYVHCDWRVNSFVRSIMDEVFTSARYINEITWLRSSSGKTTSRSFPRDTDTILWYSKSSSYTLNNVFQPLSEKTIAMYDKDDGDGRGRYRLYPMQKTSSPGPETTYDYVDNTGKIWRCPAKGWRMKYEKVKALENDGRLVLTGSTLQEKAYWNERENEGKLASNLWNDIPNLQGASSEMLGYPTQKPEALLQRIITASSNKDDLVLDCFCGSGTTPAVAEKLGRRWIAADVGRVAIQLTRKRLLSMPDLRPFVVQNLGKYERQLWQVPELRNNKEAAAEAQLRYRSLILDLFDAEPISGYNWLHGVKAGRMLHIGSVDAPVLWGDIKAVAQEFWKAVGRNMGTVNSIDVLGWDFAFELNEMSKQMAAESNIEMSFHRLPRAVLKKKDVCFLELAALSTEVVTAKDRRAVSVALSDFLVPPDDVPEDIQRAITHWSQWIDYWAIDWDYKDDTFHNQWQSYRTKRDPKLQLSATAEYGAQGTYTVVIKVIDILGNDTTKKIQVEVQ